MARNHHLVADTGKPGDAGTGRSDNRPKGIPAHEPPLGAHNFRGRGIPTDEKPISVKGRGIPANS